MFHDENMQSGYYIMVSRIHMVILVCTCNLHSSDETFKEGNPVRSSSLTMRLSSHCAFCGYDVVCIL